MKIQTINSIETSSICDNRCQYCPAPLQDQYRHTGLMQMDVFKKTIALVKHFAEMGTQRELNLFGVGEPTLNPDIVSMVAYARQHVPPRIPLHLNTNGNVMTRHLAMSLKDAGITSIDVTGHKPKAAAQSVRLFTELGIPHRVSFDAVLAPNNWAGQVDWLEPIYPTPYPCPWVLQGQVMVMSNGDVTRCCIDAFGRGVFATVDDRLEDLDVTPFELCKSCHHTL